MSLEGNTQFTSKHNMNQFLLIIAWVFAIVYTLKMMGSICEALSYTDRKRIHDHLRGFRRTFPWQRYALFAVIAWAWIITNPLG